MLSDSCFDFLEKIEGAVTKLNKDVAWYASIPAMDYPTEMTKSLEDACGRAICGGEISGDDLSELLRLVSETIKTVLTIPDTLR